MYSLDLLVGVVNRRSSNATATAKAFRLAFLCGLPVQHGFLVLLSADRFAGKVLENNRTREVTQGEVGWLWGWGDHL